MVIGRLLGVGSWGDVGNSQRTRQRALAERVPKQNTGDLQWKFEANYNARRCAGE
jgi:hypothetical protein